jgi:hypothetical protein
MEPTVRVARTRAILQDRLCAAHRWRNWSLRKELHPHWPRSKRGVSAIGLRRDGMSPRCCPEQGRIWSSSCAKLARDMFKKLERSTGFALVSWRRQRPELYSLRAFDRKTKKNKHLQINSGRRIIPLAVFQDFRSPASSKNKKPRSYICEQGETEIYFSISSLPTRPSSSLDWVSVRSCRNNCTNRLIFPNGRMSLSR